MDGLLPVNFQQALYIALLWLIALFISVLRILLRKLAFKETF